jgi:hypothetical protein
MNNTPDSRFRTAETLLEAINAMNSTHRKIAYYLEDLVEIFAEMKEYQQKTK